MFDVCFDLNNYHMTLLEVIKTENRIDDNVREISALSDDIKEEFPRFENYAKRILTNIKNRISATMEFIAVIERKQTQAESEKRQLLTIPAPPAIPETASSAEKAAKEKAYSDVVRSTEEKNKSIQAHNFEIDEYCNKCDFIKQELKSIVMALKASADSCSSKMLQTLSETNGLFAKLQGNETKIKLFKKSYCLLRRAFDLSYQAAQKIEDVKPRPLKMDTNVGTRFTINNGKHDIVSKPNQFGDVSITNPFFSLKTGTEKTLEIVVTERDADAFIKEAENHDRFKMPSKNIHRLGGKDFLDKMSAMGFTVIMQDNGGMIDSQGMISWEKTI